MVLYSCYVLVLAFIFSVHAQDIDDIFQEQESTSKEMSVAASSYQPAVAAATFSGPDYLGHFSFYQDGNGEVTATGAFQQGLQENKDDYRFKFYSGPTCEDLGDVLLEHKFKSMQVLSTAPIQERVQDIHLSGDNSVMDSPWVLADETQNLACVMLKKV